MVSFWGWLGMFCKNIVSFGDDYILLHLVLAGSLTVFKTIGVVAAKSWTSKIIKSTGQIIWVNHNISLTWIKAIWEWFPLLTMIPVRSQWGRYNLPRIITNRWTLRLLEEWLVVAATGSSQTRGNLKHRTCLDRLDEKMDRQLGAHLEGWYVTRKVTKCLRVKMPKITKIYVSSDVWSLSTFFFSMLQLSFFGKPAQSLAEDICLIPCYPGLSQRPPRELESPTRAEKNPRGHGWWVFS